MTPLLLVALLLLSLPLLTLSQQFTVLVNSVNGTSALLELQNAPSSPSTSFLITAFTTSSSALAFNLTAIVGSSASFTLSPLLPSTSYQLLATPITPTGYGTPSTLASLTTISATPPITSAYAQSSTANASSYTLTLTFASPTDLAPSASIGLTFVGTTKLTTWKAAWSDSMTLVLTTSASDPAYLPPIGAAAVTVTGVGGQGDGPTQSLAVTSPNVTGSWLNAPHHLQFTRYGSADQTHAATVVPAMLGVPLAFSFLTFIQSAPNSTLLQVSLLSKAGTLTSSYPSSTACPSQGLPCVQLLGVGDSALTTFLQSVSLTASVAGDVVVQVVAVAAAASEQQETDVFVVRVDGPPVLSAQKNPFQILLNNPPSFAQFSTGGLFTLSSSAPTASTALSVLSVTVSDGGSLTAAGVPSSTVCAPVCSSIAQSFLLYDTIANMQAALQGMKVRQALPDVAGPLYLSITFDDLAAGGYYPTHHVTSLYLPLSVTCVNQLYVPAPLQAALSTTLNSIIVTLGAAVHPDFTMQPSTAPSMACSLFLDAATMALFSHASCHFPTPRSFAIVFGYDSTWSVGTPITFVNGAFGLCSQSSAKATETPSYGVVQVAVPPVVQPLMSIIAPQQIMFCDFCKQDFVYLTAIPQSNLARLPSFLWTVPSALLQNSTTLALNQQQLVIPLSLFGLEVNYQFSVAIQYLNSTGYQIAATHNILSTDRVQLMLLPFQPDNQTILTSQPLSLGVSVNFTNITDSLIRTTAVQFTWSCSDSTLNTTAWAGVSSPNLYIPPYSLAKSTTYTFTVTAAQPGQSSTSQDFVVNVVAGDVFAVIDGGDQRFMSTDDALFLDGSLSYDAELPAHSISAAEDYSYSWMCFAAGGQPCVSRTTGNAITPPNSNDGGAANAWPIGAGELWPGVYTFWLTFLDNGSSGTRFSTAQVRVFVAGLAPQAVLSTVPLNRLGSYWSTANTVTPADVDAIQRPAGGRIINSGDQLVLFASSTTSTSPFTYSWTATGGPYALAPSGLVGASSSTFVVNALNDEFYFTPGYNYTFTLSLSSPSLSYAAGQSSVTFYINRPPVCDSFAVSPGSGAAFSAEDSPFSYSFSPFDPDENRPLALMSYQVFRVDLSSALDVDLTGEIGQTRGLLGAMTTGDPNNGFRLTVGVRAWDRYRASSVTTVQVVSQPAGGGVTLGALQDYYVGVDSVSRDDTLTLMIATSNVMSALASDYVDAIAYASSPALQSFQQFYEAYAPIKKYLVQRVLDKQQSVRAGVLVDFLAVVMADYSTLDQVTVVNVLQTLQTLMTADQELWNDVAGDPHVLQSVVYIIQQAFHATSMAYVGGLTEDSVDPLPPRGVLPYNFTASPDSTVTTTTPEALFATTNATLSLLLAHLSAQVLLPGDVLGLNYNRSLSGIIAKADLAAGPITSVAFTADPYFASNLSILASAYPAIVGDDAAILSITLLQLDGWGDSISFDIFPTFYLEIDSMNPDNPFPAVYPPNSVNLTVTYDQRACDDGWVNAGLFRLSVGASTPHCSLSCASYDAATSQFVNDSAQVRLLSWDSVNNVIVCEVMGPGLYTILKDDLYEPPPNASLPDGIVTALATLVGVPLHAAGTPLANLTAQFQLDVSYMLDVPPPRIGRVQPVQTSNGTWDVTFQILGATMISTQDSYTLFDTLRNATILATSHTYSWRLAQLFSLRCQDGSGNWVSGSNCEPSYGTTVTRIEIIAIAVVVGFFGTLILGVVCFFGCRQVKYWWDRHDFAPTAADEFDADVGATEMYGGAKSARERAEESKRRRNNRVSWYSKDVENAASYTYGDSRNSRNSLSGSSKQAAFRVRSDSRGSDDGLELDDVHVVGGADDIAAEDLAEIGLVIDGADDEDSYVMDGHKVKAVKQMREVDGEELSIDDSRMSRSRDNSLGSREFSQSGLSEGPESSRNRSSLGGGDDGPLALTYPAREMEREDSASAVERPRTPRTPGGSRKSAFFYNPKE